VDVEVVVDDEAAVVGPSFGQLSSESDFAPLSNKSELNLNRHQPFQVRSDFLELTS
jgi:hypothetical protein